MILLWHPHHMFFTTVSIFRRQCLVKCIAQALLICTYVPRVVASLGAYTVVGDDRLPPPPPYLYHMVSTIRSLFLFIRVCYENVWILYLTNLIIRHYHGIFHIEFTFLLNKSIWCILLLATVLFFCYIFSLSNNL